MWAHLVELVFGLRIPTASLILGRDYLISDWKPSVIRNSAVGASVRESSSWYWARIFLLILLIQHILTVLGLAYLLEDIRRLSPTNTGKSPELFLQIQGVYRPSPRTQHPYIRAPLNECGLPSTVNISLEEVQSRLSRVIFSVGRTPLISSAFLVCHLNHCHHPDCLSS